MTSGRLPTLDTYKKNTWLTGQLLVAMPMMEDPRFSRAVIYVCSHSPNGAMGLILNRLYTEANFKALMLQLNIKVAPEADELPVHFGGPVEPGRGFVLHSSDYLREGTTRVDETTSLSATVEILEAVVQGKGPERAVMALGYTGWGAGQLDAEMKSNGWLTSPPDDMILFDRDLDTKWERALSKIGVSASMLSGVAGNA